MNKRIQKLLAHAYKNNIDNVIITDPKNMYYFSGFYNGEGYIIAGKDGFRLYTDSRYSEYAEAVCEGFEICDTASDQSPVSKDAAMGFEDKTISYRQYCNFEKKFKNLVPLGDAISMQRSVKDESEIASIKKAVAIADAAFEHICGYIKCGMTEKEIAAELDCFMKKSGAEGPSFPTIVAAGERGSLPHAIATERTVKNGDMIVMDFGCVLDGYCSDMTRTVAAGKMSSEKKAVYDTVLSAQLAAIDKIRAGVSASEADCTARTVINKSYSGRFGHSLGHGVGLDIHESPNLSPKNHAPLCSGNVVTVEPGIYIPGFCGVRIEDIVVVGENGCEILTKSPKELICVG